MSRLPSEHRPARVSSMRVVNSAPVCQFRSATSCSWKASSTCSSRAVCCRWCATPVFGALMAMRRVLWWHLLLLEPSLGRWRSSPPRSRSWIRAAIEVSWFVFDRLGLRKALELAGWTVEAQTKTLRDRAGPLWIAQEADRSFVSRLGARGRSCALRAGPTARPCGCLVHRDKSLQRFSCNAGLSERPLT